MTNKHPYSFLVDIIYAYTTVQNVASMEEIDCLEKKMAVFLKVQYDLLKPLFILFSSSLIVMFRLG